MDSIDIEQEIVYHAAIFGVFHHANIWGYVSNVWKCILHEKRTNGCVHALYMSLRVRRDMFISTLDLGSVETPITIPLMYTPLHYWFLFRLWLQHIANLFPNFSP